MHIPGTKETKSAVSINFKHGLEKQWLAKHDNHDYCFMPVQGIMTRMYFTKNKDNHNCYLSTKLEQVSIKKPNIVRWSTLLLLVTFHSMTPHPCHRVTQDVILPLDEFNSLVRQSGKENFLVWFAG